MTPKVTGGRAAPSPSLFHAAKVQGNWAVELRSTQVRRVPVRGKESRRGCQQCHPGELPAQALR